MRHFDTKSLKKKYARLLFLWTNGIVCPLKCNVVNKAGVIKFVTKL